MLNQCIEIFPDIDVQIFSRPDLAERYVVKLINKKVLVGGKPRERLITFRATVTQVADIIHELIDLRTKVRAYREGNKKKEAAV